MGHHRPICTIHPALGDGLMTSHRRLALLKEIQAQEEDMANPPAHLDAREIEQFRYVCQKIIDLTKRQLEQLQWTN